MTIQLLLASFFSLHSIESNLAKCGVLIADASICFICVQILIAIRARRKEITDTIININKAFGLYKSGIYLSDQAINPPVARRRFVWLDIGCYVAFAGFVIALFAPFVTLGGK